MNKIFVTSDTHFGHDNIIRYCGRPFKDADSMDRELVERWNDRVGYHDVVYFLGDFAMGRDLTKGFVAELFHSLNGEIRIVLGNHDRHKGFKLKNIVEEYCGVFKKAVGTPARVSVFDEDIHEMTHEGQKFVMCHYPLNDWPDKFGGSIHLHGHQHNGYSASKAREAKARKRYDVGVDMFGGPVELTADCRFLNDPRGWK